MSKDKNKIAEVIIDAYTKNSKSYSYHKERNTGPVVELLTTDVGVELAYLFMKRNTDCDAMTDWSGKMFNYSALMKELLVLIGKPGILKKIHPTDREDASFHLMKLMEFFEALYNNERSHDWLTWLMLDQFSDSNADADEEVIMRNLDINP